MLSWKDAYSIKVKDKNGSSPVEAKNKESNSPVGGIDMNDITVDRSGTPVNFRFDDEQIRLLMQMPISGFTPVIINIERILNVYPMLGITTQPVKSGI